MKRAARTLGLIAAFLIIALLGLMAFVRLAPVDVAVWHIDLDADRPVEMALVLVPRGSDPVMQTAGSAWFDDYLLPADARRRLARLDQIALASPRTIRIAGSAGEGRITWETRSAVWGFPDYTTAQVTTQGLTVYARARFGRGDLGVNAARLRGWLKQLSAS